MKNLIMLVAVIAFVPLTALGLTVQVDSVSGTDNGSSPFATLSAALTAVAGADAGADVVNLRTNGVHALSAALTVNVVAADGDLTIQTDPGDTGTAVVRLHNSGTPLISVNVDGGQTLLFSEVAFIGGTGTGPVGGDGFQIFNSNSVSGIATIDFTDCLFAANDGANQPVPYSQSKLEVAASSYPGDDWIDYFANTQGTLTNCKISHCDDEGLLIRGSQAAGETGANVTLTGDSAISYCGGRAVQLPFQADAADTPLVFNAIGDVSNRIRFFGNSEVVADEPTITCFNGNVTLQYVDIVSNNAFAIRVDTDTCDSFSMECTRIAYNKQGMTFLFAAGDLASATISSSTFHDQTEPGGVNNVEQAIEIHSGTTAPFRLDVTDSVFTGFADQVDYQTGSTAELYLDHCALVIENPDAMGNPPLNDLPATSEVGSLNLSPYYVSITYDVSDPQNPDFLRVTDRNQEYLTASSTGGELTGGACLPLVNNPPPLAVRSSWVLYN